MSGLPSNPSEAWVVVEDENEKSFSVVRTSDVLCDEASLKLNQEVKYFWNNYELVGKIRFYNSDEKLCLKEAMKLNYERKKEERKDASFHDDRPRKAALKCRGSFVPPEKRQKTGKKKSKTVLQKELTKKRDAIIAKRIVKGVKDKDGAKSTKRPLEDGDAKTKHLKTKIAEEDSSDSDIDVALDHEKENETSSESSSQSSSEDDADTGVRKSKGSKKRADVQELLELNTRNRKESDFVSLEQKDSEKTLSTSTADTSAGSSAKSSSSPPGPSRTPPSGNSVSSPPRPSRTPPSGNSSSHPGPSRTPPSTNSRSATAPYKRGKFQPAIFVGNMFRVTDVASGTEIIEGKGIYCATTDYKHALESNSTSRAVRHLIKGTFSDEALRMCSLTGLPPRGKGRNSYEGAPNIIRPRLDADAIQAILDKALLWQHDLHWKPKVNSKYLRIQISVKLGEERDRV